MTRIVIQWQDQFGRCLPHCPPCAGQDPVGHVLRRGMGGMLAG